MNKYFDITGEDIAMLGDADLRTLVGKLCEADYQKASLSTVGIVWGGSQDSADGGFDVVVDAEQAPPNGSRVVRSYTAFQVKVPSMPPSEVKNEMMPKGKLRDSIKELITKQGAYIMVSSGDDLPKMTGLKSRIKRMRDIISSEIGAEDVEVDFLDSSRLATWARQHPGVMLWALQKVGRGVSGWHPYKNWANTSGGVEEEYLVEQDARLYDGGNKKHEGYTAVEGINHLRSLLRSNQNSVRLVGLSGVGKTRLVQALFDERVGDDPLYTNTVFYADAAENLEPDPKQFTEQLISRGYNGVMVVDNCSPELHSQLTNVCTAAASNLSVITVEYDVREHLPEETQVFRLDPTGQDLICKILAQHFPKLGNTNTSKIAECSGGNFRVAISLAKTVTRGESLGSLRDTELFARLFTQKHVENNGLLESAEVLSLLYSFDGVDVSSDTSELRLLSGLAEQSAQNLYKNTEIIYQRNLIQKRGDWRALLPHAIANNLAKNALTKIPKDILINTIFNQGTERLIKSFARRLSYLHDSEAALEIAEIILQPDGWLGRDLPNPSDFSFSVLEYIAPVAPEATLSAIQRMVEQAKSEGKNIASLPQVRGFGRILYHIAYDDEHFEHAVDTLLEFAKDFERGNDVNSPINLLLALFKIYLSGSHATIENRCAYVAKLISSRDAGIQYIGVDLLAAALQTGTFTGMVGYDFGARPRDYGFHPKTYAEEKKWYNAFLKIAAKQIKGGNHTVAKIKDVIARSFRGLWRLDYTDELEELVENFLKNGSWLEGWCAVRSTMKYDNERLSNDNFTRLKMLDEKLRPTMLDDKVKVYVISDGRLNFDPEYDDPTIELAKNPYERVAKIAEQLGRKSGEDLDYINSIAPALVLKHRDRSEAFGYGLASSSGEFLDIWNLLRSAYEESTGSNKSVGVLMGMMKFAQTMNPDRYEEMLIDIESDELLARFFISFQAYGGYNSAKIDRIHWMLNQELLSIDAYRILAYSKNHESIHDADLAEILSKILSYVDGDLVVLDILHMRFHCRSKEAPLPDNSIINVGLKLLHKIKFDRPRVLESLIDHKLVSVVKVVLIGLDGYETALLFSERIWAVANERELYFDDFSNTLGAVSQIQPLAFLEGWSKNSSVQLNKRLFNYSEANIGGKQIFTEIDEKHLFAWVRGDPERLMKLATVIDIFLYKGDSAVAWTPIALSLLKVADDADEILKIYLQRMWPSSWFGSVANILQSKVDQLKLLPTDMVSADFLSNEISRLEVQVSNERALQKKSNREIAQTFE